MTEVINNLAAQAVGPPVGHQKRSKTNLEDLGTNIFKLVARGPEGVCIGGKKFCREKLYQTLADLAITVRSLYPESATRNPFKRVMPFQDQPFETIWLFDQLVHAITTINRMERYRDRNGDWISERGDVLAALHLMQNLLNPELLLTPSEKDTLGIINRYMGNQRAFTRQDLQRVTGLSKTHSSRQIGKLLRSGLIKTAGGHKNRGYRYQLC